jgi:hypothetical protein
LFFLFFILPLFYVIVVFICSFFSSIGSFNLPDSFASGSGGSSGSPSNFPGGGGPGPNDFKLKLTHLLAKDTDVLADYMCLGLPHEGYIGEGSSRGIICNGYTLKQMGIPGNISLISGKNIAFESNVFRFITDNGYIQLDVNTPITYSMTESVRNLKLNVPTS